MNRRESLKTIAAVTVFGLSGEKEAASYRLIGQQSVVEEGIVIMCPRTFVLYRSLDPVYLVKNLYRYGDGNDQKYPDINCTCALSGQRLRVVNIEQKQDLITSSVENQTVEWLDI